MATSKLQKRIIIKLVHAYTRQSKYKKVREFLYRGALTNTVDYGKNASNLVEVSNDIKLYKMLLKCLIKK